MVSTRAGSCIDEHRLGLSGPHRRGCKCPQQRLRLEAILWILRTGAPWRGLPSIFGPWKTCYSAFRRWTRNGLYAALLTRIAQGLRDDDYLMTDSTSMPVHQHEAGPAGGQLAQAMGRSRTSLSTKIHLACDALGYPLGFILTGANVSDFDQCKPLLRAHLKAKAFALMDEGYDSDAIRAYVNQLGRVAAIDMHSSTAQKSRAAHRRFGFEV